MGRTDQEIVDQTNEVARIIYASRGYSVPEGYAFHDSDRVNYHPHEAQCWQAACEIQVLLTETDPEDALIELENEQLYFGES